MKKLQAINYKLIRSKDPYWKQRCPLCKKWFICKNGNRDYCYTCSPKLMDGDR
jgi:hypothetical protein